MPLNLLSYFLVLTAGSTFIGLVQSCENGWIASPLAGSTSCYKFVTSQKVGWPQAQGLCRDMGGYLAIIESFDENVWMRGFRSYHPQLRKYAWIGGYKTDGKWMWKGDLTDSAMLFTDWGAGEPNNDGGNQDCLALFGDEDTNIKLWFKWDDKACSDKIDFICEKH